MRPQADIAVQAGRLVYVIGPSGAGKDSIIAYARQRVSADRHVFARRHITRPADSGGEDHIAMTAGDGASLPSGQTSVTVASSGDRYAYFSRDASQGMRIMVVQRGPHPKSILSRRGASRHQWPAAKH